MSKIIIFSEFASMCKILQRELAEYQPLMIIGETPSEERAAIVSEFNATGKILIMSSAGAYGLNLQSADVIIHFDLPWSISKKDQRESRAHRIGQAKPVNIYSLIVSKSIEEYMAKKIALKGEISEKLMPITEIREMLTLT